MGWWPVRWENINRGREGAGLAYRASLIRLRCVVDDGRRLLGIVPGDPATDGRTTDADDRGVCTNRPRVGAEGDDDDGVVDDSESSERAAWAAGTGIFVAIANRPAITISFNRF